MALPKLATAKYELTLPSTNQKVEFRPFLVKEEKMLMLAQQDGGQASLIRAIQDIVDVCTFNKLDSKKLPTFDLEYVFLQLRCKSIGETANITVTCPDDMETKVSVDVNLSEVKCEKEENHTNDIKINDSVGVIFDYPKMNNVAKLDMKNDATATFGIIKSCINQIYDAENVYTKNDMEEKELDEFIESMSHDQFLKIQEFFNTMPKVKHKITVKNPKTEVESDLVLEGIQDFF
mgnify:FL=1|tara:strand:- start:251 stop:952 length:702 start_codon:yes stop_codon:yes gene_type:complete